MGRSEALWFLESRDLPFLLKYLPLNGISSWRQWLNVKDKQVGMGEGGVLGAGHGWTPPAVVAVLWPRAKNWMGPRLSQNASLCQQWQGNLGLLMRLLACAGATGVPAHWRPWASQRDWDTLPRTQPGAHPQDLYSIRRTHAVVVCQASGPRALGTW